MNPSHTLNPVEFFRRRAKQHRPSMAFVGRTQSQFTAWKKKTLPAVLATVGQRPSSTPANPKLLVQWQEDGIIKERWLIHTQPDLAAHLLLFYPAGLKQGQKRPAIFCAHGHGVGQDAVMGIQMQGDRTEASAIRQNAYGLVMAQKGFITYSIDWLGFGKRDGSSKPYEVAKYGKRDPCNVHFLCATMLGTTPMAINLQDARAATDFVVGRSYVDGQRLGVMGFSYGGTMATWLALDDERYKAANIICYAGPFYDIGFDTYNICGSQITPGLFRLVDTFDLQGLIAPKPLLVELGITDGCFSIDHTLQGHYQKLKNIYQVAGAADHLRLDLSAGGHGWAGNYSEAFFRQHLQADWAS